MASERESVMQKKMFKVITPIEKANGGGKYWMRLGTAFTNKDESINVYLDAIPVNQKEWTLQLREMDEEDFKKKEHPSLALPMSAPAVTSNPAALPF